MESFGGLILDRGQFVTKYAAPMIEERATIQTNTTIWLPNKTLSPTSTEDRYFFKSMDVDDKGEEHHFKIRDFSINPEMRSATESTIYLIKIGEFFAERLANYTDSKRVSFVYIANHFNRYDFVAPDYTN